MSFDFNNNINQFKPHSAYKDGSGMGGGGMYMRQKKKKNGDKDDEDIFEFSDKKEGSDIEMSELDEKDIPQDTLFNKFVNWYRNQGNT